jgi:eukaryotic-like serine/threonine-protein kinase
MDAERWQRLSPLLDALIELDAPARAARLAELREEDAGLAAELETLLALEEENEDFLSEPLVTPPPMAKPDTLIGPYKLERLLGEGGMGQVWLARRADGLYQRRVALKLLRPGLADPNLRQRFNRERQILARLGHPHIARLLDAGISVDNQPYLALEYVEGEAITDWCRGRDLDTENRLKLFLQVCEAVSHAHANLIVHRDLKPSNILVTPLDEVRLLDFGIAKLLDGPEPGRDHTRTEVRAFTLHYAAPEQIRGEPVTTMTDVYSLGVVLYELLAETKPYRLNRQTDAAWEEAILVTDPQKPSLNLLREADSDPSRKPALRRRAKEIAGDLDNIVLKALSKRPEQRYASVEAFALDLDRYLEGKPVLARPQSLAYRSHKFLHRHRWVLATMALVLSVLTSALGLVTWQAQQAEKEARRAQALQNFVAGLFEQTGGNTSGPLDVRELLRTGEQRANRELAAQPLARAELFGVLAKLRLSLGDYQDAERLLMQQSTLLEPLEEAPASLRLTTASDLGRAQRQLGKAHACVTQMAPLEAEARNQRRPLQAQVAAFYSELGRCHREIANREVPERQIAKREVARVLFQRSLEIRRNTLDDMAGVVENLGDLAALERDARNVAEARQRYRNALAQLQTSVGERHPLAIDLQLNICELELTAKGYSMAERACDDAWQLAVERRGADHPDAMLARERLGMIHFGQGRLSQAEIDLRDVRRRLLAQKHKEADTTVLGIDEVLGRIALERDANRDALEIFQRIETVARKSGDRARLGAALMGRARALIQSERANAAYPILSALEKSQAAEFGAEHSIVGNTIRLQGEALAIMGQHDRAREHLAEALRIGVKSGHQNWATRNAELSLAVFDLAMLERRDPLAAADTTAEDAREGYPYEGEPTRRRILGLLDRLAKLPQDKDDLEFRQIAWIATAAAAVERCRHPTLGDPADAQEVTIEKAKAALDALDMTLQAAMPDGGYAMREIARIRRGCPAT